MAEAERRFIDVRPQYAKVEQRLVALLRGLSAEEWTRQTLAPKWQVRDVAAHLLDTHLRQLSMLRDGYYGVNPGDVGSYDKLLGFLNELNRQWVEAARRLSPRVMAELIEVSSQAVVEYHRTF